MITVALVGALLVLVDAYWLTMRAASVEGRHRLSPNHPGWETAIEDLHSLQRARGTR